MRFTANEGSRRDDATTTERPGHELVQRVYHELRRLAEAKLRRLPPGGQTLQATALVHEAYLRMMKNPDRVWRGRRHFYRAAAQAMRHILIERLRSRMADKRGGGWQRTTVTVTLAGQDQALSMEDLLTLDRALAKMQRGYPDLVEVVRLRYFCGLTVAEIAEVLGMSTRTAERKWSFARAWLCNELKSTPSLGSYISG